MRKLALKFFLAGVLFFFAGTRLYAEPETVDRILAVVNDGIITERDLRAAAEPVFFKARATLSGPELEEALAQTRREILEQLIDERLIRSEARREKIMVSDEEVDALMEDVQKKFPSKEVFEDVLRSQGLTYSKLRERFRDQILTRRMTDLKIRSMVMISPGEVRAYYDGHPEEFRAPERVRIRHILVRTGEKRSAEEALAMMRSIEEELDRGTDMGELAKRFSEGSEAQEGGEMGWIEKGRFIATLDEKVFNCGVGERTQPIQSSLGYHLFRVEEKKPSEVLSFEEVRSVAEKKLYRRKSSEALSGWIEELRRNATIVLQ